MYIRTQRALAVGVSEKYEDKINKNETELVNIRW